MREHGVFREAIIPNEEFYLFGLFEFKFNPEYFADEWRAAMEYIRDSPHTIFYFLSDGEYQWKSMMTFSSREQESTWIHTFYKRHGKAISKLRDSVSHNVLKFRTDPEILGAIGENQPDEKRHPD